MESNLIIDHYETMIRLLKSKEIHSEINKNTKISCFGVGGPALNIAIRLVL